MEQGKKKSVSSNQRSYCISSPAGKCDLFIGIHFFSFALDGTIVSALLQKNEEGFEQPIAFMSTSLRETKLK